MKNKNHPPHLRTQLRHMRRELGQLKAVFRYLNKPAVYYGTQQVTERYSISRHMLKKLAARGLLNPIKVSGRYGWAKKELDGLKKQDISMKYKV